MKEVHQEHEILKIDDAFKNKQTQYKPIKCNDIFTLLRKNNEEKIVLTKGVAGIGKTVSVHKFNPGLGRRKSQSGYSLCVPASIQRD